MSFEAMLKHLVQKYLHKSKKYKTSTCTISTVLQAL